MVAVTDSVEQNPPEQALHQTAPFVHTSVGEFEATTPYNSRRWDQRRQ